MVGALAVAACGKEVGRIPLQRDGSGQLEIQAKAGTKLALWTSLDIKYRRGGGDFDASYDVELRQGGAVVGTAVCNPLDVSVKTNSVEVTTQTHSLRYQGKMKCELTATKDGPATVTATLHVRKMPPELAINDLSLVVKE
jgi:hypothetical protein